MSVDTHSGLGSDDHSLVDLDGLASFLRAIDWGSGNPEVTPLGDGHSNPTFLVTDHGDELVLRRPPRGRLEPGTHDILREARVLRALESWRYAPTVVASCEAPSVVGAPFYLMERAHGVVLTDALPPEDDGPAARRAVGLELVAALASLHDIDATRPPVSTIARPDNYLERQLKRFSELWVRNRTRDLEVVGHLTQWLLENRPTSQGVCVVHGDFRLGNVLMDTSPVSVSAVLDWEMATLGDPLADVGYMTAFWTEAADPPIRMFDLTPVTKGAGFLTRDEIAGEYERLTGREVTHLGWYQTLAIWKVLILMEGNYKRALSGLSDDEFNLQFDVGVIELADAAAAIAGI